MEEEISNIGIFLHEEEILDLFYLFDNGFFEFLGAFGIRLN
jgi:hypothetical protein